MPIVAINSSETVLTPYQKERKIVAALHGHIWAENARLVFQYSMVFSKTVVVVNTADEFLLCPPPGKPDPKADCTSETLECDTRRRVALKPRGMCFYHACNVIRFRIGPHYFPQFVEERQVEKQAFAFFEASKKLLLSRDSISILNMTIEVSTLKSFSFLNLGQQAIKQLPLATYEKEALEVHQGKRKGEDRSLTLGILQHKGIIQKFLAQRSYTTLLDYLKYLLQPRPSDEETMQLFGENPKEQFQEILQQDTSRQNSVYKVWEQIQAPIKNRITFALAQDMFARCYGLAPATWTPFQPASVLFNQLKLRGPHMVCGMFVKTTQSYETTLIRTKQGAVALKSAATSMLFKAGIGQQDTLTLVGNAHCAVIIGLKKTDKDATVYFIDASDPSDPYAKVVMTIYTMAYQEFVKKVMNPKTGFLDESLSSPSSYYAYVAPHFDLGKCQ